MKKNDILTWVQQHRICSILLAAAVSCGLAAAVGAAALHWGAYAAAIAVFCLLAALIFAADRMIRMVNTLRHECASLQLQKESRDTHIDSLYESLEQTRQQRHELRHHVETLRVLCQSGDPERVLRYLDRFGKAVDSTPTRYTDHVLINALLSPRLRQMRQDSTKIEISVNVPQEIGIDDMDLSVFLTNLLDNAQEALQKIPEEQRFLRLKIIYYQQRLLIICENPYTGTLTIGANALPNTTKEGGEHGNGLRLMQSVAKHYNSILDISFENGIFSVKTDLMSPGEN